MRIALVCVLVAACGTDDPIDLTGIYQVTVDVASMPCGTDQPVTMPPAYVKFHKEKLFGVAYFTYDGCNDAAGTDCPFGTGGPGLTTAVFSQAVSNGWKGFEKYS